MMSELPIGDMQELVHTCLVRLPSGRHEEMFYVRPSAAKKLLAEIKQLRSDRWTCKSCGCEFPKTVGDEDVERCTKCVEVEVLSKEVKRLNVMAKKFSDKLREWQERTGCSCPSEAEKKLKGKTDEAANMG